MTIYNYNIIIESVCLFVCLFAVNAKTTARIDGVDRAPHRYCFLAKGNFTSRTKMLLLILCYVVCAKNVVCPDALH